jgi:hypothetical protein
MVQEKNHDQMHCYAGNDIRHGIQPCRHIDRLEKKMPARTPVRILKGAEMFLWELSADYMGKRPVFGVVEQVIVIVVKGVVQAFPIAEEEEKAQYDAP